MRFFDDIENPEMDDTKLNWAERSVITVAIVFAKLLIRKVRKAKTYGDLRILGSWVGERVDSLGEKYEGNLKSDEDINNLIKEINSSSKEVETL